MCSNLQCLAGITELQNFPIMNLHFNRIELFYISDRSVTSGIRISPLHIQTVPRQHYYTKSRTKATSIAQPTKTRGNERRTKTPSSTKCLRRWWFGLVSRLVRVPYAGPWQGDPSGIPWILYTFCCETDRSSFC